MAEAFFSGSFNACGQERPVPTSPPAVSMLTSTVCSFILLNQRCGQTDTLLLSLRRQLAGRWLDPWRGRERFRGKACFLVRLFVPGRKDLRFLENADVKRVMIPMR
mmetsp:Transcript_27434/g.68433  ORF Transcript_27434/g.68433 Transcript_27434/m.68433 type:complete len:106 (+) Transcript_27434:706-1023(+)